VRAFERSALETYAPLVSLAVLFVAAYLMSKAYLSSDAATPLIERLAGFTGHRPEQILLGYIGLVASFSMILPNVVAAMAFVPLLPRFIQRFAFDDERAEKRMTTAYALATIWGANIGGMGAVIGGVSNVILIGYARTNGVPDAERVNFLTWFSFGVPISITLVLVCWVVMRVMLRADFAATRMADTYSATLVAQGSLGAARAPGHAITPIHARVYWSTAAFMAFWTAQALFETWAMKQGSTFVRLMPTMASVLFGIVYCWFLLGPKTSLGRPLVTWAEAMALPWRGLAVIAISSAASLALIWLLDIGHYAGVLARASHAADIPDAFILFGMMTMVAVATEFLNNVVVAIAFFPIIHEVAATLGFHPLALLISASLMSTAPFVLPTGAPSNALVIGETRGFQFGMAIRVGFVMAVLTACILTVFGMYFIPRVLGL
jgi:solute carrier family 13 (sodium-dependent dicarboxylate transporter), member 2/3/5